MLAIHHLTGLTPAVPRNGLVLYLDTMSVMSYSGGNEWRDISGQNNHIDLTGNFTKLHRFIVPTLGSFGRSRNTFNLKPTKTITVFNVSIVPNRSDGQLSGMLYEHTPDWNIVNNYSGNEYGGFGWLPNSNGSFYDQDRVHAQLRGNAEVMRGGSPYSGWNYIANGMPTGLVHTLIHDFNDAVSTHQTKAYVNGALAPASEINGSTALSTNTFDNDFLYLWSRAGVSLFSDSRLGALLIYNRVLSEVEIGQVTQQLRKRFGV